jgi:hypothetical protein
MFSKSLPIRLVCVAIFAIFSVCLCLLTAPRPAAAQIYLGEAFIVDGNVGALVNIGVEINRVQPPFPNGGPGNAANSSDLGITLGVQPLVQTGLANSATSEAGSAVTSTAETHNLSVLPTFNDFVSVNLPLGSFGLLGIVNASVVGIAPGTPLTQATVIASQAIDTPLSSATGSSTITGLNLLGNTVNASGLPNQIIPINVTVQLSATVVGIGLVTTNTTAQIGELTINEQNAPIAGFPDSLQVNALRVRLFPTANINTTLNGIGINTSANLAGQVSNTDLVFSSSTAGVNPSQVSAAPEPGSLALFGLSLLPIAGIIRRRLTV